MPARIGWMRPHFANLPKYSSRGLGSGSGGGRTTVRGVRGMLLPSDVGNDANLAPEVTFVYDHPSDWRGGGDDDRDENVGVRAPDG
jgi:hypothetical protein